MEEKAMNQEVVDNYFKETEEQETNVIPFDPNDDPSDGSKEGDGIECINPTEKKEAWYNGACIYYCRPTSELNTILAARHSLNKKKGKKARDSFAVNYHSQAYQDDLLIGCIKGWNHKVFDSNTGKQLECTPEAIKALHPSVKSFMIGKLFDKKLVVDHEAEKKT